MPRDPALHLRDMPDAARENTALADGLTSDQYTADRVRKLAVERLFMILGEALVRLKRDGPGLAAHIEDAAAIRSFRNIIVHQYDAVDDLAVFGIIEDDLPALIERGASLLDETGDLEDTQRSDNSEA